MASRQGAIWLLLIGRHVWRSFAAPLLCPLDLPSSLPCLMFEDHNAGSHVIAPNPAGVGGGENKSLVSSKSPSSKFLRLLCMSQYTTQQIKHPLSSHAMYATQKQSRPPPPPPAHTHTAHSPPRLPWVVGHASIEQLARDLDGRFLLLQTGAHKVNHLLAAAGARRRGGEVLVEDAGMCL
jgi:hypothetical protein